MAAIYLDNLIKPALVNSPYTTVSKPSVKTQHTYVDISSDFLLENNIGDGYNTVSSKDLKVSYDIEAIRNSIFNIFTTRRGNKILNPEWGSRLDAYLFESVSNVNANIIGKNMLSDLEKEPRIEVKNITIKPNKEEQIYNITLYYRIIDTNVSDSLNISLNKLSEFYASGI